MNQPRAVPLWLLCLLALVPDLTGAMIPPTLPYIAETFSTSMGSMQLTTTAYLLATALSQPIHGPLADTFGRRRMILITTAIVAAASLLAAAAPSLSVLIGCRIVEGCGASAAIIIARTAAYDTRSNDADANRAISYIVLTMSLGMVAGPIVSGTLMSLGSGHDVGTDVWRAPFLIAGGITAAIFLLVLLRMKETAPVRRGVNLRLGGILWDIASLARAPCFVGYTLVLGSSMAGITSLIATVPLLGRAAYRLEPQEIGLLLSSMSGLGTLSFWLSGQVTRWISLDRLVRACLFALAATVAIAGAKWRLGGDTTATVIGFAGAMYVLFALINVPSITGTLGVRPDLVATAASISTAFSLLCASIASQLTAAAYDGTVFGTLLVVGGAVALGLGGALLARGRNDTPARAIPA